MYSLKFSLGTAFTGIVVLTASLLGIANYMNVREYARNEIREKMRTTVAVASLLVDPAAHDAIETQEHEESPGYLRLKDTLRQVRLRNADVRFVYTFRKSPDGKLAFVVDSEDDPAELSHVGDVYEEATPALLAAFEKPYEVQVESDLTTDKWGTWLSAFGPILRPDGSLAGVIGMDVSAAKIVDYERRFLMIVVALSLGVFILVAALGLYFARAMSRPLVALAEDMARIQSLDLSGKAALGSRIREVLNMGVALDNMKMGLRSFRKYVPAELVTELIAMRQEAELGASEHDITVFFSDIADFTGISEQLGAAKLSSHLGEYFEAVTRTILDSRGTVDKYIGDAVMAFWGAPRILEGHASAACLAALQCQRNLDRLFESWRQDDIPPMTTRIGLNSGIAVVGNMGYRERLAYTAVGDTVNLASRLENLNKFYGTRIVISEQTYALARGAVEARPIDKVVVKGKTTGVLVYELVAEKGALDAEAERALARFGEAMQLYLERNWKDALRIWTELAAQAPRDRPTRIMIDRCRKFVTEPPAADWTGVIVLRDK